MGKDKAVVKREKKEFPVEKLQEIAKLEGIPVTGITILGGKPYINVTGLDRKVDNKCEREKVIHVKTLAKRIADPTKENGYLCAYYAEIEFFDRESYLKALETSKASSGEVLQLLRDTFTQRFSGEGWASPDTCEGVGWKYKWSTYGGKAHKDPVKMLIENIIMMAERRATNRAKREATGTGLTSLDEMPLDHIDVAADRYEVEDEIPETSAPPAQESPTTGPPRASEEKTHGSHGGTGSSRTEGAHSSDAQGGSKSSDRHFAPAVAAVVVAPIFKDWAKTHGLPNMADVKDMLEVYAEKDLDEITIDEFLAWQDHINAAYAEFKTGEVKQDGPGQRETSEGPRVDTSPAGGSEQIELLRDSDPRGDHRT